MKKRGLSLLLALALCLSMMPAAVFAEEGDFVIEDGVLTKYTGSGGAVTIPSGVTSIGDEAFNSRDDLQSITIPSSVTSIGHSAFAHCTSLTSVTIPSSVTSIEMWTFGNCTNLQSITIPSSVTSIGTNAFFNCKSLTDVNFNGTQEQWKSISMSPYDREDLENATIHCSDGNIGSGSSSGGGNGSSSDTYEITASSRNQTITSGGATSTTSIVSGWKSSAGSAMMNAKVQSIEWSVSDSSVVTVEKSPFANTESMGISSAVATAKPGVTKDTTVTVTVKITYTYNGKTYTSEDSTNLTVKAQDANADTPKLTVSPTTVNLAVGEKATVTATLTGVKNYSDYRMSWQNIYDNVPFTVSGVTKSGSWNGNSNFDSQGRATITITGSKVGSTTFFPILQTSAGKQVNYEGNDGSRNVTVTVSGGSGATSDIYEITANSRNQIITSGGATSTTTLVSGWKSSAGSAMMNAKVQSIEWSVSDTSVVTVEKSPFANTESMGISSAVATAKPGLTKDTTVTVTVKITYTYNGKTYTSEDSTNLTIKAQDANADKPKLTVSPTTVNLAVGEKATVTATLTGVKNYSDYRMSWQNIYGSEIPFTVSGVTKSGSWNGNSNFDSQGRATITITGSKVGSTTFFPILQTSAGKQVNYEGNDGSGNVTVTVSKPITVSFNSNGGSSVSSKTVATGQTYGALPTPTRKDYTFDGWYTSSYGGSKVTSDTIVTSTYNHTLYAHWIERKEITVSFNSNGGSSVSSKTVIVGEQYGTLPTSTREGYTFDGWYTSSTGGNKVTSGTTVSNKYDHTLYAHWIQADGKLTVSPSSVNFNKAQEGYTQPTAQTVTVKNTGKGEVALSQPTASYFELGGLSSAKLAANASATFTVRPKAGLKAETYSETITIKSTDGKTSATLSISFAVDAKTSETPVSSFTDVPASSWYYPAVMWAVENGITSGTGDNTFSPDAVCTRGQVVTLLYRAVGQREAPTVANPFTDVQVSDYYYQTVLWAMENNITGGTSATSFSPDEACTRGQVVTFLWRAAGQPEPNTSSSTFADVRDTGAYYYKAVLWAVENGITSGTSDTSFSPEDTCTRGQIVAFLYRAYK